MSISADALAYVAANGLRSKMIASNCRRFERVTGITEPKKVTPQVIAAFRQRLTGALSEVTIEKTVTDVLTVVKHCTGAAVDAGKRLKRSRPEPQPAPIDSIDAIYDRMPVWIQQWLVIAYWTGLRLHDSLGLQLTLQQSVSRDALRWRAGKTGHNHAWPVPSWLVPHLEPAALPYSSATLHFCRLLRQHIAAACHAAHVPEFCPQQLRQRSITEWTRANATAGQLVHGCGIGVLSYYLDPLSVLEAAAPMVRLPACFGATVDTSQRLLQCYQRLDSEAQGLVVATAERMVRC